MIRRHVAKRHHSCRDLFPAELVRAMGPEDAAYCAREASRSPLSAGLPADEAIAVEYWRQRRVQAGVPASWRSA